MSQSAAIPATPELVRPSADAKAAPVAMKPLLSSSADLMLAGGASILCYLIMRLVLKPGIAFEALTPKIALLSLLVNYPHLLVSYQLLYGDRRRELLKNRSYLWAAVGVPLILVGIIAYASISASPIFLRELLRGMFILVGWHYVKQSYGAMMVFSARERFFMSDREKSLLRYNMYALWALHFLAFNRDIHNIPFMGVTYQSIATPAWMTYLAYGAFAVTFLAAGRELCKRRDQTGRWPPAPALAAMAAIYVWYVPILFDPTFYRVMPFFHSAQYLLFVLCLKRNQNRADLATKPAAAARAHFLARMVVYCLLAVAAGHFALEWLPATLDRAWPNVMAGTPMYFTFAFMVAINVHHYFIDNVIWRRDNPGIKQHLFSV